jgi:uncharacterized protein YoxC
VAFLRRENSMVQKKRAKKDTHKYLNDRLATINIVLERLESEVERAVGRIRKKSEQSSKVIKNNIDEVLERVGHVEIISRVTSKTEEMRKEVKRLADDVILKVKKMNLDVANSLVSDIRTGIDEFFEKVRDLDIVEKAKDKATSTRLSLMGSLSIPTDADVRRLSRKVGSLEKKIRIIYDKKAA